MSAEIVILHKYPFRRMEENQKTTQDKVKTLAQEAYTNLPPEMKCPICKQLMVDASLNPCCGQSFCDDCKFSIAT